MDQLNDEPVFTNALLTEEEQPFKSRIDFDMLEKHLDPKNKGKFVSFTPLPRSAHQEPSGRGRSFSMKKRDTGNVSDDDELDKISEVSETMNDAPPVHNEPEKDIYDPRDLDLLGETSGPTTVEILNKSADHFSQTISDAVRRKKGPVYDAFQRMIESSLVSNSQVLAQSTQALIDGAKHDIMQSLPQITGYVSEAEFSKLSDELASVKNELQVIKERTVDRAKTDLKILEAASRLIEYADVNKVLQHTKEELEEDILAIEQASGMTKRNVDLAKEISSARASTSAVISQLGSSSISSAASIPFVPSSAAASSSAYRLKSKKQVSEPTW